MEYRQKQQEDAIKTEFAARKRNQIMVSIPLIAMVLLLVFSGENPNQAILGIPMSILGPAFLVIFVGGVGFSLYNWRCPACTKYLGKAINPKFCSKCGVALS